MEGNKCGGQNGSSSESRPPNPLAGAYRQCFSSAHVASPCRKSLVRHPSLVKMTTSDVPIGPGLGEGRETEFIPIVRSGGWADIGFRSSMEDAYVCVDNFTQDYGLKNFCEVPNAFYGVFDGHGGKHAADFACSHLPRFIIEDEDFPMEIERAVGSAFLQTDTAFAEACTMDTALASGTTALATLVVGRRKYLDPVVFHTIRFSALLEVPLCLISTFVQRRDSVPAAHSWWHKVRLSGHNNCQPGLGVHWPTGSTA